MTLSRAHLLARVIDAFFIVILFFILGFISTYFQIRGYFLSPFLLICFVIFIILRDIYSGRTIGMLVNKLKYTHLGKNIGFLENFKYSWADYLFLIFVAPFIYYKSQNVCCGLWSSEQFIFGVPLFFSFVILCVLKIKRARNFKIVTC